MFDWYAFAGTVLMHLAIVILKGIELVAMLKKGQQRNYSQSHVTPVEQFYALTA